MKHKLIMENWRRFVLKENLNEIPQMQDDYLYHGTSINNVSNIQQNGLEPQFGNVVKGTEAYDYYMDDDYWQEEDRVKGVLFFSDEIDTWKYGSLRDGKFLGGNNMDEAALVIVENNDTIYRMLEDMTVINSDGYQVDDVDGISIDRLPPFIERTDYFSFESQAVVDVLFGDRLKRFIEMNKN